MMDEKMEKMLRELYRVTKENNDYLKKIDRRQRYGMYWKVLFFIITAGSVLGVYYMAQPYVDQVLGFYNQFETSVNQFNTIPSQIKDLVN
jgi:hypothetical protein